MVLLVAGRLQKCAEQMQVIWDFQSWEYFVPAEVSEKATTTSSGCWNASELCGRINLIALTSKGGLRFSTG